MTLVFVGPGRNINTVTERLVSAYLPRVIGFIARLALRVALASLHEAKTHIASTRIVST